MAGGFLIPGATDEAQIIDPYALARRRRVAEALTLQGTDASPIQHWTQGLARMAQAGLGTLETHRLDSREDAARKSAAADTAALFGGGTTSSGAVNVFNALAAGSPATPGLPSGQGKVAGAIAAPTFTAPGGAGEGMGDYLAQTRARESGGSDTAKNPNSTATGRYQFTEGTWASLMQRHPQLGLSPNGRTDPALLLGPVCRRPRRLGVYRYPV